YIDYDALTAFRSLKVQKKRRISLSGPDHDQIDRHFCELLPWPPGTSLLPTSAASVLPKAKRPPQGTIPPEGLKTELGLLCPTLFIPAVARFLSFFKTEIFNSDNSLLTRMAVARS